MTCCGEKRAQLLKKTETGRVLEHKEQMISQHKITPEVATHFQYIGKTGLTVIGRETQRLYRFDRPGAVVVVDKRDQHALEALPTLRLVRKITS